MNVWILKEVESKEILGAYDKKEQAMLHAESFVGGRGVGAVNPYQ